MQHTELVMVTEICLNTQYNHTLVRADRNTALV